MHSRVAVLTILASLAAVVPAAAQVSTSVLISSPSADQALLGTVRITGTATSSNFASAELDFAYAADTTDTWFVIQTLDQPVTDAEIASWETITISDGEYVLRLRVNQLDGSFQDAVVRVQVRNYTSAPNRVATAAPSQTPALEIPSPRILAPSQMPEPTKPPTPTALQPNEAASTTGDVYDSFLRGAIVVLGLSAVVSLLLLRRRP